MSKTIMLIHGAWLDAHSWEGFKARYEAKGYTVVAPSWPLDDRSPAELRASPNPVLAKVGINELIDHYDRVIRALPEPPILIGHSLGGTVTQHLLDRGLGMAGVVVLMIIMVVVMVVPIVMRMLAFMGLVVMMLVIIAFMIMIFGLDRVGLLLESGLALSGLRVSMLDDLALDAVLSSVIDC